jgi:hypothetical protein
VVLQKGHRMHDFSFEGLFEIFVVLATPAAQTLA